MFEAFDTTSQDVLMTVFPAFGRVGYAWIAAGLHSALATCSWTSIRRKR